MKGDNPTGWSQNSSDYSSILIKGKVSLSGNIMWLLDNGTGIIASIPNSYCFYRLFQNSTGLVSISENFLHATTLTDRCYDGMFYNCTSLTTAPDLPATNLATQCYWCMFDCCKLLNSIKIGYTGDYDSDIFTLWVAHTHSSGTFYYNGSQDAEDFGFDDDWITQRF